MQTTKMEAFSIIGISIKTTNENEQSDQEIPALWNRFMAENIISKIPNKIDDDIYSLYVDYESDHTKPYTTIIGCKVKKLDTIPNGMIGRSFHGGNYAKTSIQGDLMNGIIKEHWLKIFDMELDRTYTVDFEIYGEKAKDPSNAEVDFYVGIQPY